MTKDELPKLPDGMHWEPWAEYWAAVDDLHGGAVTINFDRRNFEPGWSLPYRPRGKFMGRGWKDKLVAAAVELLREGEE